MVVWGDDCIFKRVECGQLKEGKGNDHIVNVFSVPGYTVVFPATVSFVRPHSLSIKALNLTFRQIIWCFQPCIV